MKTGLLLTWELIPDTVTTITDSAKLGSLPSDAAMVTFENTGTATLILNGKVLRPGQSWNWAEDAGGVINLRALKIKFTAGAKLEISTFTRKNYKYINVPVNEERTAN